MSEFKFTKIQRYSVALAASAMVFAGCASPIEGRPVAEPVQEQPCEEPRFTVGLEVKITDKKSDLLGEDGPVRYQNSWDFYQAYAEESLPKILKLKEGGKVAVSAVIGKMELPSELSEAKKLTENAANPVDGMLIDSKSFVFVRGPEVMPFPGMLADAAALHFMPVSESAADCKLQ